jgi:hypothetical protein
MTSQSSTSATQAAPAEQREFLHRVIRIIAGVMLAYALFQLAQAGLAVVMDGSLWDFGTGSYRPLGRAIQLSHLSATVLLAVGAAGMLKLRPWSRPTVMLWAILVVILQFASYVFWLVVYARAVSSASTQYVQQPVWKMMLTYLLSWLSDVFFPLLIWLMLRQSEVINAFSSVHGGGFEVVPLAQRAGGGATGTSTPE